MHASVGKDVLRRAMWGILFTRGTETRDFLVPRFTAELFQDGNSVPPFMLELIGYIFGDWLNSLRYPWFPKYFSEGDGDTNLLEHKLIRSLEQISPWLDPTTGEKWYSDPYFFVDIYVRAVEKIINPYRWSIEITIAVFQRWSKMVVNSGIDITSYVTSQDTNVQNKFRGHIINCCKDIHFQIVHDGQHDSLSLNITTTTLPKFSNLDPNFLCEISRPRRETTGADRCISQVDKAFIEDGKFSMNIPGQWEEPLIPNSNLVLVLCTLQYMFPEISYRVYGEQSLYASDTPITEADIQQVEEDLRNGTLLGLGKD